MGLRKGQTNNPNGRRKGSKNKDNQFKAAIKEGIPVDFILKEIASIEEPKDRVPHYIKMLEFAHPKMKSVEVSGDLDLNQDITISRRVIK